MDDDDYRTESEVEADSDHEDTDTDHEYGGWFSHFDSRSDVDSDGTGTVRRRNKTIVTPKMAMESFRFSFLNSDENQDVNFDAILGELCELETQLNTTQSELSQTLGGHPVGMTSDYASEKKDGGSDMIQAELDALAAEITQGLGYRKSARINDGQTVVDNSDIGETDSAFSDNASLPSSESFTSMATVSSSADTTSSSSGDTCSTSSAMSAMTVQSEEEQKARLKAEKIRIALEKIKEAKIRKLFVRAFAKDGSSKSILVDEKMTVGQVSSVLADKNHIRLKADLAVVEHMPDLFMERILEDHDSLVENMVMWTRDSKNKVLFEERQEKYDLFKHPEKYLLLGTSSEKGVSLGPKQRESLIQEFFSSSGVQVPEVEGALYLKSDGKKAWKKYFFVLRASGLYYNPKGKAAKDLACLVQFDFVETYHGLGWKKKYHAPTDYCFALKHPQIQKKSSKYIRYFCAESKTAMDQWIMGIRMAKFGKQLLYNYEKVQNEVAMWDLRDDTQQVINLRSSTDLEEHPMLNNVGNLQDSRMSVLEPGIRHSIVTVKNSSLVRNSSTSGPDCDNPNEVIGIEVTPMPQRKGSLGGVSGGDPSPQQKTPVKRVSFSNTHCIINADSCEELVQLRHRDSITSASTDSSEDSTSSGEGRQSLTTRGKLRPKLPVTTETTRQISEMFHMSMDSGNIMSGDSAIIEERKSSLTYSERRRSSSSSSMHERRNSETGKEIRTHSRSSSGPMSPLSPPPQRHSDDIHVIQSPPATAQKPLVSQPAPLPTSATSPPPSAHHVISPTATSQFQRPAPPPVPQNTVPQPPVMPPAPTIPAPNSPLPVAKKPVVPLPSPQSGGNTLPSQSEMPRPPPPPPPQKAMTGATSPPPPPPPPSAMPKSVGPFNGSPQSPQVCRSMVPGDGYINGNPAGHARKSSKSGLESTGGGSPSRTSIPVPPPTPPLITANHQSQPPTTAPKPKPQLLSPVNNHSLGSRPRNSPTVVSPPPPPNKTHHIHHSASNLESPCSADHGIPVQMPPPMPLLQASPTQTISQRISHMKHPSTGTTLLSNNKQGPKCQSVQRTNVTTNGGIDDSSGTPIPFLMELSKRSHVQHGHSTTPTNHTAECVPTQNQTNAANHRRSASAGGSINKPQGPPVAQKPDNKRAPPPPPPKRSEHTRLSSDQARQIQLENQAIQDPIYENCEGIMDINELPPPPPELLEGLAAQAEQQKAMQKKSRPPPPPPKRSKDTQLTHY